MRKAPMTNKNINVIQLPSKQPTYFDSRYTMVSTESKNGMHNPTIPLDRPVDIRTILAPVQTGLRAVETKLKTIDSDLFAPLAGAFMELIDSGGKRMRPALALMAAQFNGELSGPIEQTEKYERVLSIAAAVEMLHTATLVHDDVIDGALLRRGSPTLNAQWNGGTTVLAGDYLFGQAAHFAAETGNMRVIEIFNDTLNVMVEGELNQIFDRFNYEQEKDSYYNRIYAKTASLFCAATEPAGVLSDVSDNLVKELRDFGYNLGMAFQIVDDILDFTGDDRTLGKPAGSDLRQGSLTLPFFYYYREQKNPQALVDYLKTRRAEADKAGEDIWSDTVANLVVKIRASDAIESARQEALDFLGKAQQNLIGLPDNIYKQSMLDLCSFVVQRTY